MERKAVSDAQKESEKEQVWKLLSEAGLVDVGPDDFPERIKEAKAIVLRRLSELLQATSAFDECQSAAYSLGTLTQLEVRLGAPQSTNLMRSEKSDK